MTETVPESTLLLSRERIRALASHMVNHKPSVLAATASSSAHSGSLPASCPNLVKRMTSLAMQELV